MNMPKCAHGIDLDEYCGKCCFGLTGKTGKTGKQEDEINHPQHYKLFPDMEAFDVIKAALTPEELRGYLKGNVLKYRLRAGEKGPVEKCIGKADWYKARLFEQEQV